LNKVQTYMSEVWCTKASLAYKGITGVQRHHWCTKASLVYKGITGVQRHHFFLYTPVWTPPLLVYLLRMYNVFHCPQFKWLLLNRYRYMPYLYAL